MMPEKIKIGGIKYKIEKMHPSSSDACAKINFEQAIIFLDYDLNSDVALSSLLHEVIETISKTNELEIPHHCIQTLETQLFQVLRDNPDVFK